MEAKTKIGLLASRVSCDIKTQAPSSVYEYEVEQCSALKSILFVPCQDASQFDQYLKYDPRNSDTIPSGSFHPLFTHQFFEDEILDKEWQFCCIQIFYDTQSLDIHMKITGDLFVNPNHVEDDIATQTNRIICSLFEIRFPSSHVLTQEDFRAGLLVNYTTPLTCIGAQYDMPTCQDFEVRVWGFTEDCVRRARQRLLVASKDDGGEEEEPCTPVFPEPMDTPQIDDKKSDVRISTNTRDKMSDSEKAVELLSTAMLFEDETADRKFHMRAEWIAHFLIEACSPLPEHERWTLLFLFKSHSSPTTKSVPTALPEDSPGVPKTKRLRRENTCKDFVGLTSLYEYFAYPKNRLRLAQSFILPPFQKRGYCYSMLKGVISVAASRPEILELTLEDPTATFQVLRSVAILAVAQEKGLINADILHLLKGSLNVDISHLGESLEDLVEKLQKDLKTPKIECEKIKDIVNFRRLLNLHFEVNKTQPETEKDAFAIANGQMFREYRMASKQHIFILREETVEKCATESEKRRMLHEMWEEIVRHQWSVLKKLPRNL